MSHIATHPPSYALALPLNTYPSYHTGGFHAIRASGLSLLFTGHYWRFFPSVFHFSCPLLPLQGRYPLCRCDPCIFVVSYESTFLGPSVVFVQGSGTFRNLSTRYQGCLIAGLSSSCGCTRGSCATRAVSFVHTWSCQWWIIREYHGGGRTLRIRGASQSTNQLSAFHASRGGSRHMYQQGLCFRLARSADCWMSRLLQPHPSVISTPGSFPSSLISTSLSVWSLPSHLHMMAAPRCLHCNWEEEAKGKGFFLNEVLSL